MDRISMREWSKTPATGDTVEHHRIGDCHSDTFTVPAVGETVKIRNHRRSYMITGDQKFRVGNAEFVLEQSDRYRVETPVGQTGESVGTYRRVK